MDLEITPEDKLDSISEISVFDNYMGNLCTKYEFSIKESRCERIEYPKRNSLYYMAKSAFLPEGYPKSVSKDYLEYQIWDTVQVFFFGNVCRCYLKIRINYFVLFRH